MKPPDEEVIVGTFGVLIGVLIVALGVVLLCLKACGVIAR